MSKSKKQNKYCNCQSPSDKAILKQDVIYSFCKNCGSILLKSQEGIINYTLKPKQKRLPYEIDPVIIIKQMKKKTEECYPYIYEEFNINKSDKQIKEKTVQSINIYLKFRKMLLLNLQKLMKMFDYCDMIFYQTLFYLDYFLSQRMTEDMTEKTVLYYLVGYFLCAVKFRETDIYEPSLDSFFDISKDIYLFKEKIVHYEVHCLKSIDYNVFSYSAYDWISQLISNGIVFNCEINNATEIILVKGHRHSLVNTINKYAVKLLLNLTFKNIFFKYSPMYIAISLIQIAREKYLDKNMIKEKLFFDLINLYGIKYANYKKCYEEIKSEFKENIEEEEDKNTKDKEKKYSDTIKYISDEYPPNLKGNNRNENSVKSQIKGRNLYVPNKLKSSNSIIHLKDNQINNNQQDKEELNNEESKAIENNLNDNEIELSLKEVVVKKRYKIKSQKEILQARNPAVKFSIDCNTNVLRDVFSNIDSDSKERYSLANLNKEDKIDLNLFKNNSLTKNKHRPILKELNHVKINTNKHPSIKIKDVHNTNSNASTSVERDKDNEKSNIKKKSKFYAKSNKNMNKFKIELEKKNILTSTKLPILTGLDDAKLEKTETNNGELNINQNRHKVKIIYKLKKTIDKLEIKTMPEEEININKSAKKII